MIKQLLNKLKQEVKILKGTATRIKKEVNYNSHWYGSNYGGFYVHPDKLNSNSIVYSFGIGEDITFDKAIIEKHQCQVFGFDPTPKSINWISTQQLPPNFTFLDFGIDSKTGLVDFHLPKNKDYVSGSVISHQNVDEHDVVAVQMKSFNDIVKELGHNHIDVLKMDIEGSEYNVIESILSSNIKIDQILIELHERFFTDGTQKTKALLKSFNDHGYAIFGVSDSMEEISLIKIK